MLKHLLIRNYALIQQLELEPSAKLNIITGETGAGKSIMLGALGLLLGNRADTKVLFDEGEKCIIEGTFDVSGYHLKSLFDEQELDYAEVSYLRREITPSGKSRAFINDTPVKLDALRTISSKLMDIHSQHDNLLMSTSGFQLNVIDAFAGTSAELAKYKEVYRDFKKAEKAYKSLLEESREMQKAFDFNQHLFDELDKVELDNLNQAELETELEKLENAETIKSNLNTVLEYLANAEFSVEAGLKSAAAALGQIKQFSPKFNELKERIESVQIELSDINLEVEGEESDLFLDHEQISFLQDKLDNLYTLQKKHHVQTVEELLAIRNDLQEKVDKVLNFDGELEKAEKLKNEKFQLVKKLGATLTEKRNAVKENLESQIAALLNQLGMPNARLHIKHQIIEATSSGFDDYNFLFSANKGIEPQELKNVASGGEFSRLMLSIKYILAGKTQLPTIIFDEIDTGISGEISIKVGIMMQEMSENHQVIAISHLPQIAAKGDAHYFVYKDNNAVKSVSKLRKLTEDERIKEIAAMIGGANPSETAFQSARELMQMQ
ncbi:DNA repair protein RecN [Chondrinema litorale]|uniref:DNA repair protein RecN n=1 Tax=Chondrinema litorale TaxID=2994555 RepID=UPI0025445636|nr:DNA repair protein RecN [Chondrinema litorale]UZR94440.1 DNA repair protein RecN [Chondrinema litorale]